MADLTFSQTDRPSPIKTILGAAAALAVVAALVFYFNPHDTAAMTLSHTHVIGTRTNFKSDSIVVDEHPQGQDDLYVITTLQIDDHLRSPITIDTVTATLTTDTGASTTGAVTQTDLPAVFGAFPQLKPFQAAPLLRETTVEAGKSASGQLVFHFPVTKAVWDARKSASITVELYHQTPQTIAIP